MTSDRRYRMFKLATILCASIAVTAVCVIVAVSLWASTRRGLESSRAIRDGGAKNTCDQRYAQRASTLARRQLSVDAQLAALNQRLLKVVATVPADNPAARVAAAAEIIERGDKLADELDALQPLVEAAGRDRDNYLADGRPLPCPLDDPSKS